MHKAIEYGTYDLPYKATVRKSKMRQLSARVEVTARMAVCVCYSGYLHVRAEVHITYCEQGH